MSITVTQGDGWNYFKLPRSEDFKPIFKEVTSAAKNITYLHAAGHLLVKNLAFPPETGYETLGAEIAQKLGIPDRAALLQACRTFSNLSPTKVQSLIINYGLIEEITESNGRCKALSI